MVLTFRNITGKKETKGFAGKVIVQLTPTKGDFKISPDAAALLKIAGGDNIIFLDAKTETGEVKVFMAKGIKGKALLDETGQQKVDGRGRKLVEENTEFGAVVAEAGVNYKATGAYSWELLKGSPDKKRNFVLEPVLNAEGENLHTLETDLVDEEGKDVLHTTPVYELVFTSESNKQLRKDKNDSSLSQSTQNDSDEHDDFDEQDDFDAEEV